MSVQGGTARADAADQMAREKKSAERKRERENERESEIRKSDGNVNSWLADEDTHVRKWKNQ